LPTLVAHYRIDDNALHTYAAIAAAGGCIAATQRAGFLVAAGRRCASACCAAASAWSRALPARPMV
jgi:hypothetical protein